MPGGTWNVSMPHIDMNIIACAQHRPPVPVYASLEIVRRSFVEVIFRTRRNLVHYSRFIKFDLHQIKLHSKDFSPDAPPKQIQNNNADAAAAVAAVVAIVVIIGNTHHPFTQSLVRSRTPSAKFLTVFVFIQTFA